MQTTNKIEVYFIEVTEQIKKQNIPEAINLLQKILNIDPKNKKAKNGKLYLEEIVRFNNTDIFANTNLFMDPWE